MNTEITEEQKQKYLERTKVEYAGGAWRIWADFVGGASAVGDTVEVAARNYARGVAEIFNHEELDWELFLSQPPL